MSEVPSNLQDMVTKYGLYLDKTLNGKIFETVKFWMTSAEIVGLILLLQGAVKISFTKLYSFAHFNVAINTNANSWLKNIKAFADKSIDSDCLNETNTKYSL